MNGMGSENAVIFKGTREGIAVILDKDTSFEMIKYQLLKKIGDAAKFFDGYSSSLTFKGKELTDEQEDELVAIIRENTRLNISFVHTDPEFQAGSTPPDLPKMQKKYNVTKFYNGAVRSGQEIEFSGSVVIVGDVNPGGVVKAGGNIIILGALKGMAHAGAQGMDDAFVFALNMSPVQLRIGSHIARFPEDAKKGKSVPEYAYTEGGKIYVMQLV